MSSVVINATDVFDELSEENNRLLNELISAIKCLKALTEFKSFVDLISIHFVNRLDSQIWNRFEELSGRVDQVFVNEQFNSFIVGQLEGLTKNEMREEVSDNQIVVEHFDETVLPNIKIEVEEEREDNCEEECEDQRQDLNNESNNDFKDNMNEMLRELNSYQNSGHSLEDNGIGLDEDSDPTKTFRSAEHVLPDESPEPQVTCSCIQTNDSIDPMTRFQRHLTVCLGSSLKTNELSVSLKSSKSSVKARKSSKSMKKSMCKWETSVQMKT